GGQAKELMTPRSYSRLTDPWHQDPAGQDLPLMALGITDDLEPEITEYRVREGDWILLATDGANPDALAMLSELQQNSDAPADQAQKALEWLGNLVHEDNLAISLLIF